MNDRTDQPRLARRASAGVPPVVLVHGMWLHATSWAPWVGLLRAAGHDPLAPPWPGEPDTVEEARESPESIAGHGLDDIAAHVTRIVDRLGTAPVVVGNGVGGAVARILLEKGTASAAVLIDDQMPCGALSRSAMAALGNPASRHRALSLTPDQFRVAFCPALTEPESRRLHRWWAVPAPGRPLFEHPYAPGPGGLVSTAGRPVLLVRSGGAAGADGDPADGDPLDGTAVLRFPDRGPSLAVDSGWAAVAEDVARWIAGLSGTR